MQAEERYGRGGYICTSHSSSVRTSACAQGLLRSDVGNGEYQPAYGGQPGVVPPQPNYGATGGAYAH